MNIQRSIALIAVLTATSLGVVGCKQSSEASQEYAEEEMPANPNLIAIPASVRTNLGISFVEVERRRVEQTLRVPGHFEYLPTARTDYRTMLPGRVALLVDQFDRVEPGTPLYRIESPSWRDHQEKMTDAQASIQRLRSRLESFGPLLEAHRTHEHQLEEIIEIRKERVAYLDSLAEAGGGRRPELISARDDLATAQAELAEVLEKEASLEADEAEARAGLAASEARFALLLGTASALVGLSVDELNDDQYGNPRWRVLDRIEVRAESQGVVETIDVTSGAWATRESSVLTVVQPERLRFRASGLQSDLGVLRDGLPASIVPPTPTATGRAVPLTQTMEGTLTIGLTGDAKERTVDLFVAPDELRSWAKAGVSAHLEIALDPAARETLAIPLSAVQRDGLTPVIFRRNPDNMNEVERIEADLGKDDGRWVSVASGVRLGDQIVLDGAFQLMLATSGTIQKGGHFHSDGTYHAEDH